MLGLLLAGIAAVVFVVRPAWEEYRGTHGEEERLRADLAHEESERQGLEMRAEGLDKNPRIIERTLRDQGLGRHGEVRYVRPAHAAPAEPPPSGR